MINKIEQDIDLGLEEIDDFDINLDEIQAMLQDDLPVTQKADNSSEKANASPDQYIELEKISYRAENDFSMKKISKLADNIEKVGLTYGIAVVPNKDKTYTICDGERRYRAFLLCKERAEQNYSEWVENHKGKAQTKKDIEEKEKLLARIDDFKKIKCVIMNEEQTKNEEEIHNGSNNFQRVYSLFEIIARYNPGDNYFGSNDDNKNRRHYLDCKYDNGWKKYKKGEIKGLKWSQKDQIEDIYFRVQDEYSEYEISMPTVKRYVQIISALSPKAVKMINNEAYNITLTQATLLAETGKTKQYEILDSLEKGEIKSLDEVFATKKEEAKVEPKKKETDDEKFVRMLNKMQKFVSKIDLSEIDEDKLSKDKKKEFETVRDLINRVNLLELKIK